MRSRAPPSPSSLDTPERVWYLFVNQQHNNSVPLMRKLTIDSFFVPERFRPSGSGEKAKVRQKLGDIVGQEGAQGADEADALDAASIKPVKAIHCVERLKHLSHRNKKDDRKKERGKERGKDRALTCFAAPLSESTSSGALSSSLMFLGDDTKTMRTSGASTSKGSPWALSRLAGFGREVEYDVTL